MIQYDDIKNEELRELAKQSESINTLPEKEAQKLISKIAALPEEGQKEMLENLKEEQKAVQTAKKESGITSSEDEVNDIKEKTMQIKQLNHEFKDLVRKEEEGAEQEKAEEAAETALKELGQKST